jgi:threonine dehydratase
LISLADLLAARQQVTPVLRRTPVDRSDTLSHLAGRPVVLKPEHRQRTGSFKIRGAYNHIAQLPPGIPVVAASAGNHAQGVALAASLTGRAATIYMPRGASLPKVAATRGYGALVRLEGEVVDDCIALARTFAAETGAAYVPPFDDAAVIAGQGTVALELLAERPDLDAIVVPVGGGGLVSGIAVAAKGLKPGIEVLGVQSTLYPSMYRLLRGVEPGPPAAAATLAEGIAVKEPGLLTRAIVAALVDDILLADEAMLESAVEALLERQRLVVEGAGAAGLAAVFAEPGRFAGKQVAIVVSGGNIDARLLASILMRGLVREGRLVRLRAELPDVPGALSSVSGIIGRHAGNIVEVHHQRLFHDTSVRRAELDVVVETQNRRHVEVLIAALNEAGYPTRLLLGADNGTG